MFNELMKNVMNLGIITADDVKRLTAIELMMLIIERSNGLLNQVEMIDEKLVTLLENIRTTTIEELNKWTTDGTFDTIINQTALNQIIQRLDEADAQLSEKANKNEIFSMANMGQDIKEAMTGGSVAVVGKNAVIGYENIVDKTIPIEKTDFLTPFGAPGTKNLYNKNNSDDYNLTVSSEGNTIVPAPSITSFVLKIKPNTTYSIEKVLSNRFWVATTSVKPDANTPINYQSNFYGQTKCTFTTTENDNFLMVAYYKTDDELTIDKIRNTIKVYEGSNWVEGSGKYEFKKLKITNENMDEITSLPKLKITNENTGEITSLPKLKITNENIVDKTIPIEKTDFLTPVGPVGTKNLYNKNNSDDYKLTIASDGNTIVPASVITSFVLEIKPKTTYSIEKVLSNRFWVATTSVKPDANTPINYQSNFYGQTKCTFTSTESDNFLLVAYYKTDDELTIDKIRNSIKVYEGSTWVDGGKYEFKKLELDLSNIPNFLLPSLSYKPLGVLEKGYVCLIADDGSTAFMDTTLPVLQEENVKYTVALMKDSPMFVDANKDSYINTLKNEITLKRCSICYHGGTSYTEYKSNELVDFLNSEKEFFKSIGLNPVGCCYPNHDHNIETQVICGNMLGICCDGNRGKYYEYQLNGARSNLYELTRTSLVSYGLDNLKLAVNTAIDKKQLLIVFWHDISLKNDPSYLQILKDFISYAKTTEIEFITLDELGNMI